MLGCSRILRSILLCSLTMAGPIAPGSLAAAANNPPGLSAQQIVDKNVAARGGLAAWRKVQTMLWTGHIESARANVPSMQFMLSQQRPNKTRFEINAMGARTMRGFDGARGWKLRAVHGRPEVEPYTAEELRFAQSGPGLDPPLMDYAAKGSSVELRGVDEIDKHRAYHLIVRTASGESQHVWVDAESFLEVRYDRASSGTDGASRTISVVYRDYKSKDGLQIPYIIETGAGPGSTHDRMVIERVLLNPPLPARTFSAPGDQRARARVPFPHRSASHGAGPHIGLPPPLSQPTTPPSSSALLPGPGSTPGQDPGSTPQ